MAFFCWGGLSRQVKAASSYWGTRNRSAALTCLLNFVRERFIATARAVPNREAPNTKKLVRRHEGAERFLVPQHEEAPSCLLTNV